MCSVQVWEIIANTPCLEPELLCWALPSKRCHYDARSAPTTEVTTQQSFGAHRYRVRIKCQKGRGEVLANACDVFGCEHVPFDVTKAPTSGQRAHSSGRWLANASSEFYNFSWRCEQAGAGASWCRVLWDSLKGRGVVIESRHAVFGYEHVPPQHRSIVQQLTAADPWLVWLRILSALFNDVMAIRSKSYIQWTHNNVNII